MNIKVEVRGVKELQKSLTELPKTIKKKALVSSQRDALKPVLAAYQSTLPRRSGRYAMSLRIRAVRRSRTRVGVTISVVPKFLQLEEGEFYYPAAIEYGWRSKGQTHTTKGFGELRQVFNRMKVTTLEKNQEILWNKIEQIVASLPKGT